MSDYPSDPAIEKLLSRARKHIDSHDLTNARLAVEEVCDLYPSHPQATQILREIQLCEEQARGSSGRDNAENSPDIPHTTSLSDAIEALKRSYGSELDQSSVIDSGEKARQDRSRLERKGELIDTIDRHLAEGSFEKALELIDSAMLEYPGEAELQQLEKEAQQAIEDKIQAEDLFRRARILSQGEQYDEAVTALEKAIKLDPKNPEVKKLLIEGLLASANALLPTDWKAPEALLQRVQVLDPENVEARRISLLVQNRKRDDFVGRTVARARELQAKGQINSAEQVLRDGLKHVPDETRLLRLLNVIRRSQGERPSSDLPGQVEKQIEDLIEEEKFAEADRQLQDSLKTFPNDSQLLRLRAVLQEAQRRNDRATELHQVKERINGLSQQRSLVALNEARSLARDCLVSFPDDAELREALDQLDLKIDRNSQEAENYAQEAEDHLGQGDLESATRCIRQALEVDPENEHLLAVRKEIRRRRWSRYKIPVIAGGSALALVVLVLVVIWLGRPVYSEVVIASNPPGARLFIDGEEKGVAGDRLRLKVPKNGTDISFRLSLDKHQDYEGSLTLKPGANYSLGPFYLNEILTVSPELQDLYNKAFQAYNDRRLISPEGDNAAEYAERLIAMDPEDRNGLKARAIELKGQIKSLFWSELEELPKPQLDTERELELLRNVLNVDPEDTQASLRREALLNQLGNWKRKVRTALDTGRLFPPGENAYDLLENLDKRFPQTEGGYLRARRKEIQMKVLATITEKCRSAGEECTNYHQAVVQKYFPGDAELRTIFERAKPTAAAPLPPKPVEDPAATRMKELESKADAAHNSGRYGDAVPLLAEMLRLDARHPHALDLKNTIHGAVLARAAELARSSYYSKALAGPDDGRRVQEELAKTKKTLDVIYATWKSDYPPSKVVEDIANRLELLDQLLNTGESFPVSHLHGALNVSVGKCEGDLAINGYRIKHSSTEPKDAFDHSYPELKAIKLEKDRLELSFPERAYKFKARPEGRQLQSIKDKITEYQKLREKLNQ